MLHLIKYAVYTSYTKSLYFILALLIQFPSWHVKTGAQKLKPFFFLKSQLDIEQNFS